jgi:hypothetical protein
MPRFPNKVLLNQFTTIGSHKAIKEQYKALDFLAQEILELGIVDKFDDFTIELEQYCEAHDDADSIYLIQLKTLVDKTRRRIDDYLKANPQIQP